MNSRTIRGADSKSAKGNTHPGSRRPATLSLKEPAKEDGVPLLAPAPPMRRRAQAMTYPMTPRTPDPDIDCLGESSASSQSSSASSTFTFNLLSPTTPHYDRGFSFTACPSSPLDESMVYAFPPQKRQCSTVFPMRPRGLPSDYNDTSIEFVTSLPEDPLKEGMHSPSDDRKYFHVRFLQEDSPFPRTPDC